MAQKNQMLQDNNYFSLPRPKYAPKLDNQPVITQTKLKKRHEILKKGYIGSRRFTVDVTSDDYIKALLHNTKKANNNLKVASRSINDLNRCTVDSDKVIVDSINNIVIDEDLRLSTLPNMKIRGQTIKEEEMDENDNFLIRPKGPEFIVQSALEPKAIDISDQKVSSTKTIHYT
jgi:hypothetical protein